MGRGGGVSPDLGDGVLLVDGDGGGRGDALLRVRVVLVAIELHVVEAGVDDELLRVVVPESYVERLFFLRRRLDKILCGGKLSMSRGKGKTYDGDDGAEDGRNGKGPGQVRVLDGRGRNHGDDGGNGRHEEVDGGDEALHVLGRLGVGDAVGGDVDEDLGNGRDDGGDGVHANVHRGEAVVAKLGLGARAGRVAAGGRLVHLVREHRVGDRSKSAHGKAESHAGDGAEADAGAAKAGVDYGCVKTCLLIRGKGHGNVPRWFMMGTKTTMETGFKLSRRSLGMP